MTLQRSPTSGLRPNSILRIEINLQFNFLYHGRVIAFHGVYKLCFKTNTIYQVYPGTPIYRPQNNHHLFVQYNFISITDLIVLDFYVHNDRDTQSYHSYTMCVQ